jgi:polar amino acid transport system substrate-binding protein
MIADIKHSRASFLTTTCALLAGLLLCGAEARADAVDDITKAGVVRVGVFADFPPFASVGTDMSLQGYDVDIAQIIADALKVKLQLVPVVGQNRIPMLQERRVDMLLSVGYTDERAKVVDYTPAYAPYYTAIWGTQDIKVQGVADLAGKVIAVNRGTLEDTALTAAAPPSTDIRRFDNYNAVIQAFLSGQVPLMVLGNDVGARVLERQPSVKPEQKFTLRNSPDYIVFNKNEQRLNQILTSLVEKSLADGTLDRLSVKWLKKPLDPATLRR